ncbi:MAG: AAA family ATPase [Microthrixaceae bacterium]
MRISSIHLESFGQFTDRTVELGHPTGGLRIVVGPNEAGKSTLLWALRVALFGTNTNLTAGQPTSAMRLSFDYDDGDSAGTIRRVGQSRPSRGDGTPLDDSELADLVNIDKALFGQLFTINHDELRRYGEPLLQADGGIGELVFGAALGGHRVKELRDELAKRVDELFRQSARTKELNVAINAVVEADTSRNGAVFTAERWASSWEEIDELTTRIDELGTKRERLLAGASRLDRITTIRPQLVRRAGLEADRQQLTVAGPVPSDQLAEQLGEALDQHTEASDRLEQINLRIAELRDEQAQIPTDRRALTAAAAISALAEEIAVYRTSEAEVKSLTPKVAAASALADAEQLRAVMTSVAPLAEIADTLAQRASDLAGAEAGAHAEATRLGVTSSSLDAVLSLDVPALSVIESHRVAWSDLDRERKAAAKRLKTAERELASAESTVDELERGQRVATVDDIRSARKARNSAMKKVRRHLLRGPRDDGPGAEELADKLDDTVATADAEADTVIDDTDRAARVLAARGETDRLRSQRDAAHADTVALAEQLDTQIAAWTELWVGVTGGPASPDEMREWRDDWTALCSAISEARTNGAALTSDRDTITEATDKLRRALEASGNPAASDADFLGLLDSARRLIEEHDAADHDRSTLSLATGKLARLDGEIDALLPILDDTTLRGDRAISALDQLREQHAMDDANAQRLSRELDERMDETAGPTRLLEQAEGTLGEIAEQLRVRPDALADVHDRIEQLAGITAQLDQLDEDLLESTGIAVEQLVDEADQAGPPDAVQVRRDQLKIEAQQVDDERDRLVQERERLTLDVQSATSGSDATAAAEAVESALAHLGATTQTYVRTALAKAVLDQVVEFTGGGGQDMLIDQASRIFADLTDGEFSGIGMQDVNTRTVATAIRSGPSGGVPVFVPSLSDGTQDQLWLSFRLAGIFEHVTSSGPIPVVIDDLLVNFDDNRAGRALGVLAELAEFTQVIVTTHHPHLVDIARATVGADKVMVSELAPRSANAPMMAQVVADLDAVSPAPIPEPTQPAQRAHAATSGSTSSAGDGERTAMLAALRDGPGKKSELVERSGIDESLWTATITSLVDSGEVVKNGYTYALAASSSDGDESTGDGDQSDTDI